MAYEWVAPLATSALGVAGIYFTWLTGKQAREHAEQQLTLKLQHDREAAQDERQQQRRAEAYVDLLGMAERVGYWAAVVRPLFDLAPPEKPDPLPDLPEQAQTAARIGAFESAEVREQMELWRSVIKEILAADQIIAMGQAEEAQGKASGAGSIRYFTVWEQLDLELRPRELRERSKLTALIAHELGSRPTPESP